MNTAVENMFAQAAQLPQIPKVVQEVINSLNNDDIDISSLAQQVRQDQVISAKILRLANSSFYGGRGKVSSIDDAVTLIGLNAFRTLIIASGISGAFPKVAGLDLPSFWKHSMLVANVARAIARHSKQDAEAIFTGALMHSIGEPLIYMSFPDGAQQVSASCKGTSVAERKAIERSVLHLDHCEVGAELARRWHFPTTIQDIIAHYAEPAKGGLHAHIVYASVLIAQGLEAGEDPVEIYKGISGEIAGELKLSEDWFEERREVFALLLSESASLV
jgi:putative nucleotidyltransferase with HDIG domain